MKLTRKEALEQGYHLCGNAEIDWELYPIEDLEDGYIEECSESDTPIYIAEKEAHEEQNGVKYYNLTDIQLIP